MNRRAVFLLAVAGLLGFLVALSFGERANALLPTSSVTLPTLPALPPLPGLPGARKAGAK